MSKHVLIIDDEPLIRDLLSRSFDGRKMTSVAVPGGREALRAASERKPDLIITDLQLAEGDGLDVINDIKRQFPDVPVMLLTGILVEEDVADAMTRGQISSYKQKTESLAAIMEEADRLMRSPSASSQ